MWVYNPPKKWPDWATESEVVFYHLWWRMVSSGMTREEGGHWGVSEGDGGWVERVNEKLSENGNFREANLYGGFV